MKKIIIGVLALAWTMDSFAIVNIENMRTSEPEQGFSGYLDVSISGESGNSDKIGASIGTRHQWQHEVTTDFVILRFTYGESLGVRDTNKVLSHARHIRKITERRAYEGFVQVESDEFSRLTLRTLLGGGVRLTFAQDSQLQAIHLGVGAFYAVETLDEQAGLTDDGTDDFWRLSSYLSYKRQINDHLNLLSTTYYQPAVDDASDYRLMEEAALSVKMTDRSQLKISIDVVHDSQPPQGVEKTDFIYSTGLEYRF